MLLFTDRHRALKSDYHSVTVICLLYFHPLINRSVRLHVADPNCCSLPSISHYGVTESRGEMTSGRKGAISNSCSGDRRFQYQQHAVLRCSVGFLRHSKWPWNAKSGSSPLPLTILMAALTLYKFCSWFSVETYSKDRRNYTEITNKHYSKNFNTHKCDAYQPECMKIKV